MDKHITFLSDGVTVKSTYGSEGKILSVEGIASNETDHNVIDTPFMPGSQTNSIRDKQRFITMQILVPKVMRSYYLHFFRVNSYGQMTVKYGDVERFIEYIISASTVDQPTVCQDPVLTLTFRCAYPYFKDVDGFGENLGEKIPLIWPGFLGVPNRPIVAAYTKFDRYYPISNVGEVPVGIYVRIRTTGTVKNPRIMLTDTNMFIKVGTANNPVAITKDDLLEISTVTENGNLPDSGKDAYVRLNGVNILNKTDQFSTFFQIAPGEHSISYDADDGAETLQVWLWRNWAWSWV